MFRRLAEATRRPAVSVFVDGRRVPAHEGDSVAAAMLAAGHIVSRRTAVAGAARAPYCLMGICFECLVAIDGVGNRQACMVAVRDGMRIETGKAKRELGA
jgi:sarcosine oxidase subunit alpha